MSTRSRGGRIKALREHRGWSGRELARRVGISNTYVSNIENDRANLRPPVRRALAAAFGWAEYESMIRSDAMEPPAQDAAADNAIAAAVRAELGRLLAAGLSVSRRDGDGRTNSPYQVRAGHAAAALVAAG